MKKYFKFKRLIALTFCTVMMLGSISIKAHAEGGETHKVTMNGQEYETLVEAVNAVKENGTATITLGTGTYTLYSKKANTKGKNLTFIGQGIDQTYWRIGADELDPSKFGTEYNGDYSFDGANSVTFKNMTLMSKTLKDFGSINYLGFIRPNDTLVENCKIIGGTSYWGYKTATFTNTIFENYGDYALWDYSSPVMTFDTCTFNGDGKFVNVYREGSGNTLYVNFKNCTVNSNKSNKSVLNIKDANNNYIVNISGKNTVNGITPNNQTCSDLFQVESVGDGKSYYATVSIDDTVVWEKGAMVSHAIDCANDKYTSGYKDDAFDITYDDWQIKDDGTLERDVIKTCQYCGYEEKTTETKNLNEDISHSKTATMLDDFKTNVTLQITGSKESVKDTTLYAISKGSRVRDVISNKFALAIDSLKLNVGNKELSSLQEGNTVYFGDEGVNKDNYRFKVEYVEATAGNEAYLVWTINESVETETPISLIYTLQLINPEIENGVYGVKDLDGDGKDDDTSAKYDISKALYVSESTVLNPINSNGNVGDSLTFTNPSVIYTVDKKDDNPDTDVKGDEVDNPNDNIPSTPVEDDTLNGDVLGDKVNNYSKDKKQSQVKTSDNQDVFIYMVAGVVALVGISLVKRKKYN